MDTFLVLLFGPTGSVALFKRLSLVRWARVPRPGHSPFDAFLTCCGKPSLHTSDPRAGSRTLLTSTIRCKRRPPVNLPLRQCLASLLLSHFPLGPCQAKANTSDSVGCAVVCLLGFALVSWGCTLVCWGCTLFCWDCTLFLLGLHPCLLV